MRPRWGRILGTVAVVVGGAELWTSVEPAQRPANDLREVGLALPQVWMGSKGVVWRSGSEVHPGLEWVIVHDGEERVLEASGRMFLDFRRGVGPGVYSVCLARAGVPITQPVSWKQ